MKNAEIEIIHSKTSQTTFSFFKKRRNNQNKQSYISKNLPCGKYLSDVNLYQDIVHLFSLYAEQSERLSSLESTQSNDIFNFIVSRKNPKTSSTLVLRAHMVGLHLLYLKRILDRNMLQRSVLLQNVSMFQYSLLEIWIQCVILTCMFVVYTLCFFFIGKWRIEFVAWMKKMRKRKLNAV